MKLSVIKAFKQLPNSIATIDEIILSKLLSQP